MTHRNDERFRLQPTPPRNRGGARSRRLSSRSLVANGCDTIGHLGLGLESRTAPQLLDDIDARYGAPTRLSAKCARLRARLKTPHAELGNGRDSAARASVSSIPRSSRPSATVHLLPCFKTRTLPRRGTTRKLQESA